MVRHTDREYEGELRELNDRILKMAGRVEAMVSRSVRALVERDPDLARATILLDESVNADEVEIDEQCQSILARRQPLAGDLRFISCALKMVTDLERIGDIAVNLCERAIELAREPALTPIAELGQMALLVQEMLKEVADAFTARAADRARAVIRRDDMVDELYHGALRTMLSLMSQDPRALQRGIHTLAVAKFLERIGDHATNLAEEVVYLVDGKDIRHAGKRAAPPGV
ncbi:MAG: phosphate signaling complex protein PhoU [Deltaproteobacteria bacterium]|nr:phosphate signaling complex protein PhoU [Deltaproteobacteria bacterium]